MRDDGLWLEYTEVVWFAAALDTLVKFAGKAGSSVPQSVLLMRQALQQHLDGRADGRGGATAEPVGAAVFDDVGQWIDAEEVAQVLDVTPDAVRKSCRAGRLSVVARKYKGRWWIPADCVKGAT